MVAGAVERQAATPQVAGERLASGAQSLSQYSFHIAGNWPRLGSQSRHNPSMADRLPGARWEAEGAVVVMTRVLNFNCERSDHFIVIDIG